jgi:hypothetical protein
MLQNQLDSALRARPGTGRAGSVWARLCLANGLAALALPLEVIALSIMGAPDAVHKATFVAGGSYAAEAGAQAGAVLGGAMPPAPLPLLASSPALSS